MRINIKALLIGMLFFVAINGGIDWYSFYRGTPPLSGWESIWHKFGFPLTYSLLALCPGFILGYLAKGNALIHGVLVALVGSCLVGLGPTFLYSNFSPYFHFAFYAFIKFGFYCVAMSVVGEYVWVMRSNNSFKVAPSGRGRPNRAAP